MDSVDKAAGAGVGAGRFPFVLPGRYTYLGALVGGAQGQLVKLHDEKMLRFVALKVLQAPHDQVVRLRFRSEVAALLELAGHPNVVTLYDYEETEQHLLLFMEYCEQGSLADQVAQGSPPSLVELLGLGAQVASGLAAAHARGIVHRDIKPGNLLRSRDAVKIGDFGIATLADLDTPSRTRTGGARTDRYSAPEVLAGAVATPASDVYSLAVTLTELAGTTTADLLMVDEPDRTQIGGAPLLTAGAQAVRHLLASMLAAQPADRPSAVAVATRLQDAQRRLAGSAQSPGTSSPAAGAGHHLSAALKTDVRRRDRGQPPDARSVTAPRVVPSQPRRPRPRTWLAVLGLSMALLLLVAAVGLVVLRSHKMSPSRAHATFSFAPEQYRDGLLIVRRWTLGGKDGSLLTEAITASSATGKAVRVKLEEPIPAAIASSVQSVRFRPAPSRIIRADPLVEWDLALPARGTIDVGYQATVGPAGATRARLAQWAKEFDALAVSLNLPRPIGIGVRSLSISPATLRLGRGASRHLALKGLLSDGQAAPHSLLAGAAWSTTNSAVAAVKTGGAVVGIGPGTAVVTAQLGTARASAVVTVTGTPNLPGGDTSSPAPGVSSPPGGGGVPSSSPSARSCTPRIATVGAFEAAGTQTVYITGSCFGTGNTSSAADTTYFEITDLTQGWSACWTDGPGDLVTCNIFSWTGSEISFSGFAGYYGQSGWVVSNGDDIEVKVWNAQSGKGPATCQVVVGSGSPTSC